MSLKNRASFAAGTRPPGDQLADGVDRRRSGAVSSTDVLLNASDGPALPTRHERPPGNLAAAQQTLAFWPFWPVAPTLLRADLASVLVIRYLCRLTSEGAFSTRGLFTDQDQKRSTAPNAGLTC